MCRSSVAVGEWNLSTDPDCVQGVCAERVMRTTVDKAHIHPHYNGEFRLANDIALLRLRRRIAFNGTILDKFLPGDHTLLISLGLGII